MKIMVTISILLLLCGCNEKFTGLGSVDLRITSITFRDSDPATITGTLPSGKPADFITAVDAPQVQAISVLFASDADTSGLSEANTLISYPLSSGCSAPNRADAVAEFEIQHNGLFWTPVYSVKYEEGSARIYASALLKNTTAQTWKADTLRFLNPENSSVTTATGRITVNPGSNPIPWWDAPVSTPQQVIRYGWPIRGRWNPLIAYYCPAAGRVESWTNKIYKQNDTLWIPADSLIELDLTWQQMPGEYRCFMEAVSLTDEVIHWKIQWPLTLPRGASLVPGIDSFELSP
ncbi:MAG: hypothetical protein GY852_07300, partial [bacterium]|nr:hypothetical protein [bacterium]